MLQFRVGPFPVRIEASFLITALLLGWRGGAGVVEIASWVAIVFVSVLVHELGHALVGLSQGGQPAIILQGLGGVTFPQLRKRTSYAQQIWLSVAGPLAGLVPGAIALAVLFAQHHVTAGSAGHLWNQTIRVANARDPVLSLLGTLAEMSLIWTVLNLVPVLPLDGGHVLEIGLTAARKKNSAALANWISAGVGFALAAALYLLMHQLFAAIFFVAMAVSSIGRARVSSRPPPVAAPQGPDAAMLAQIGQGLAAARSALSANDFPAALQIAEALEAAPDSFRRSAGARIRAGALLLQGENEEAGRQAGRAYSLAPQAESAVLAARAAVRSGRPEIATVWLRRARESGAPVESLKGDSELGALLQT